MEEFGNKSIDGWIKYKELWDKGGLNAAQQKKFLQFDNKLRNELSQKGSKLPELGSTISQKGKEFTTFKPVEKLDDGIMKVVGKSEYETLKNARTQASKLLKSEGKKVTQETIEKALKRIPGFLAKGAKAAAEGAAKHSLAGLTGGIMEAFDAESLGDLDQSSLGNMIENPDLSALQRYQAQEVLGEPQTLEGKDYTNYAKLNELKLDADFRDAVGENPTLEALGRKVASVEDAQVDRLINRMGEQPTEDTIGTEGENEEDILKALEREY